MEDADEEPTLPLLPPSLPLNDRRKRMRDTEPPPTHSSNSSDPAFFSSDDDPALDNYQSHGRRKRRYVGTWYEQQPASSDSGVGDDRSPFYPPPRRVRAPQQPKQQKREFRRQLDSGVWMGTDGCLTDTDDSFDLEPAAARLPLAPPPRPPTAIEPSQARSAHAEIEQAARNIISVCVENGTEQVDLSDLGLETVSPGLLDQISDIAPIPTVAKELEFEQRDPEIKVFLSNNFLWSFPLGLLNVDHLTVLSLRANRLTRITPAIVRLQNLETLNIAQNSLRFLPGELLQLLQKGSKLHTVQFHPNPFWQPDSALPQPGAQDYEDLTFGPRPEIKLESSWSGVTTKLVSRTPVHFTDSANRSFSDFKVPPPDSKYVKDCPVEPFTSLAAPSARAIELRSHATSRLASTRGPKSLFELALGACAASGQADRVAAWLGQTHPELAAAVELAADVRREGGMRCSVCGRDVPVPLAQWLEFRLVEMTKVSVVAEAERGQGQSTSVLRGSPDRALPVPFLRVGCSWSCVPVKVEVEAEAVTEE